MRFLIIIFSVFLCTNVYSQLHENNNAKKWADRVYNSLNNDTKKSHNLNATLKLFKKYFKEKKKEEGPEFYDWLLENTNYIEDYNLLNKIYEMFDLSKNHIKVQVFDSIRIANGPILKEEIQEILKMDGFIFKSTF